METDNSTGYERAAKPTVISERLPSTGEFAGQRLGAWVMVAKPNSSLAQRIFRKRGFDLTEALLLMGLAAGAKLLNLW